MRESPADEDGVDGDGEEGEDHLGGQGGVGLSGLVQLRSVPGITSSSQS